MAPETEAERLMYVHRNAGEGYEVILPPARLQRLEIPIIDGPNAQGLEHCHFAPRLENMRERAPYFHLALPIRRKGDIVEWPSPGTRNPYRAVEIAIVVRQSNRICDFIFDFEGHAVSRLGAWNCNPGPLQVRKYSAVGREGVARMAREEYIRILEYWGMDMLHTVEDKSRTSR